MLSGLLTTLAIAASLGVCVALVARLRGHPAVAHGLNGAVMAVTAAGAVLASVLNPDAGLNAPGLAALAALVAVAGLCWHSARQGTPRSGVFWSCWALAAAVAASLVYLRWYFRPF